MLHNSFLKKNALKLVLALNYKLHIQCLSSIKFELGVNYIIINSSPQYSDSEDVVVRLIKHKLYTYIFDSFVQQFEKFLLTRRHFSVKLIN